KTASNVDRQSVIVGRKWKYIGVGGGAVAEKYRDPKGAMNLWIPLPGGQLTYTTDFSRIHIWEAESILSVAVSDRVEPYLLARYYYDHPKRFYQVKGGIKLRLK
ncbi:MAG: hypothetical protein P9M15_00935, partial [Candidatus Electryoneaceae bacterium]|nr:hypothetical protein [Candidatus Electryoneaceae bacterium]